MQNRSWIKLAAAAMTVTAALAAAHEEAWPTFMHDSARSGVSKECLKLPLAHLWTHVPLAQDHGTP